MKLLSIVSDVLTLPYPWQVISPHLASALGREPLVLKAQVCGGFGHRGNIVVYCNSLPSPPLPSPSLFPATSLLLQSCSQLLAHTQAAALPRRSWVAGGTATAASPPAARVLPRGNSLNPLSMLRYMAAAAAAAAGGERVPVCDARQQPAAESGPPGTVPLTSQRLLTNSLVMGLSDKIHSRRSALSLESADQVGFSECVSEAMQCG